MKLAMMLLVVVFSIGLSRAEDQDDLSRMGEDRQSGSCTQANKAKTLYLKNSYEPELYDVTEASTSIKATLVQPLRQHDQNGIYEATTFGTRQKNGDVGAAGYFGVQWKGSSYQKDMLIFSVWDAKRNGAVTSRVMPLPTPSEEARGETDLQCKRNCNDCAVHGHFTTDGTGVKCFYNLPRNLEENDELTLKIEREPVQSTTGGFRGHVWRVSVEYTGGPNGNFMREQFPQDNPNVPFVIGRILFDDGGLSNGGNSPQGIHRLSNFHEHIGCTPCGSFPFEAVRRGPFVLRTARGGGNTPRLAEGDAEFSCKWAELGSCTCRKFDAQSFDFGEITFKTGGGNHVPHWNPRENSRMFWMEGGAEVSRDGGSGGNGSGGGNGGNNGGCTSNQFRCSTGKCIPMDWKCDDYQDCPDNSDEAGCGNGGGGNGNGGNGNGGCSSNEFSCLSGGCIPSDYKCDNYKDCTDNSDETGCGDGGNGNGGNGNGGCNSNEFSCSSGGCIPSNYRCDNYKDCSDNSDETGCGNGGNGNGGNGNGGNGNGGCTSNQFECLSGGCIPNDWKCDNYQDCTDNSDESGCGNDNGGNGNGGGGGQQYPECTQTYHANGFDCKKESGQAKKDCKAAKKTYNSKHCQDIREQLGMG